MCWPGHCENFRWFFPESEAFILYATDSVKFSLFVPFMEVLLIDSWCDIKDDNQNKFLRQAVSLSVELFPLEPDCQTTFSLIAGSWLHLVAFVRRTVALTQNHCSTWILFPANMSPYQGNYPFWLNFSDSLSLHRRTILPLDCFC